MVAPLLAAVPAIAGAVGQFGKGVVEADNSLGGTKQQAQTSVSTLSPEQIASIAAAQKTQQEKNVAAQGAAESIGTNIAKEAAPAVQQAESLVNPTTGEVSPVEGTQQTYDDIQRSRQFADDTLNEAQAALEDSARVAAINPQGIFANMDGGQVLLGSLGLFLGGIGAGLSGGPNLALKLLEANRDIAIKTQQKTFENHITQAKAKSGVSQSAASNAQTTAMANQIAGTTINANLGAISQTLALRIQRATAKQNGQLVSSQFAQDSLNSALNVGSMFRQQATSGGEQSTTYLGQILLNAASNSDWVNSMNLQPIPKNAGISLPGKPVEDANRPSILQPVSQEQRNQTSQTNTPATSSEQVSKDQKYTELMNGLSKMKDFKKSKSKLDRNSLTDFYGK